MAISHDNVLTPIPRTRPAHLSYATTWCTRCLPSASRTVRNADPTSPHRHKLYKSSDCHSSKNSHPSAPNKYPPTASYPSISRKPHTHTHTAIAASHPYTRNRPKFQPTLHPTLPNPHPPPFPKESPSSLHPPRRSRTAPVGWIRGSATQCNAFPQPWTHYEGARIFYRISRLPGVAKAYAIIKYKLLCTHTTPTHARTYVRRKLSSMRVGGTVIVVVFAGCGSSVVAVAIAGCGPGVRSGWGWREDEGAEPQEWWWWSRLGVVRLRCRWSVVDIGG